MQERNKLTSAAFMVAAVLSFSLQTNALAVLPAMPAPGAPAEIPRDSSPERQREQNRDLPRDQPREQTQPETPRVPVPEPLPRAHEKPWIDAKPDLPL